MRTGYFCSLLEMPYGHFLSAISAFVPNNSGYYKKMGERGQ